jgi:fructose-bisphosphate aldolase class II
MLMNVREMLTKAWQNGYAVGAFNTVNIETTRGILDAARAMQSPVIIQMTEKSLEYAGGRVLFEMVNHTAEYYYPEVPMSIHLDHGKSFEIVERAVEIGFPSVMYDGSRHHYADNVAVTKKVVELCHAKGVTVQAELGSVPYLGEMSTAGEVDWEPYMTKPEQAQDFVEQTGIDVLAVAIGNAHGFVPERATPDYDRLSAIRERVSAPIVMHGASDWDAGRVGEVMRRGVSCFNVDTATRLAFLGQLKRTLTTTEETDLRKVLGGARDAVQQVVSEKMRIFASAGKWKD